MSMLHIGEIMNRILPKPQALEVTSVYEFVKRELPPRENILAPWLPVQGLTMIYAPRGIGKTHVALGIAHAVANGTTFLNWSAPKPRSVLYLDGEMPATLMQERLKALMKDPTQKPKALFQLLTPDLQHGAMPDLATYKGQEMLEPHLKDIDLIIIDNISTLCRNSKENEADSWLPVQDWALTQRAAGKSILFIHHAGKGGHQRGTSKREDILDTVIALKRPDDYNAKDGAIFQVTFEKARCFMGNDAEGFEAQLIINNDVHEWQTRAIPGTMYEQVISMAKQGLKQKEIAEKMNLDKSGVSRYIKTAHQEGRIQ
ncbi:AAA family ATPase [Aquicella siphonis]|nr:AAA family ATPase [Aquicella siphonis]